MTTDPSVPYQACDDRGQLAELALFAVLFTDGMRVGWADLRSAWRLPAAPSVRHC